MKLYIAIGISFLAIFLLTEYHYYFSAYTEYTLGKFVWGVVFVFYFILSTLVLLLIRLIKKTPSYKGYTALLMVGFFLGGFTSFIVSLDDHYGTGYLLIGFHLFTSIIFLILCLIFIPKKKPDNKE